MGLVKRITRSRAVQETLGLLVASYLKFVHRTNRFVMEPADAYDRIGLEMPVIAAMWHGQHFMIHFAKRPQDRAASLVSRSGDGEFNAIALRHLGVRAIRGSGARGRDIRKKGGVQAMRAMMRALSDGEMVVMTADIPKIARVCGEGIVTLAQISGRPIVPVAVVTSRRIDFDSWDKASIGLPFGRGAIVLGEPTLVPRDADPQALEAAREAVERELDAVHERAYALVGSRDPGARARKSHANAALARGSHA
ncbi:lysophospholipid acyltransferase family protein [Microvirga alba]|uniref:Lysophospholipid acyltransferase family protein n=1 Tax=Microvirga alba TaxID=2791025 RepID=A0A931FL35_9HYPH|nr:lysophospholipid acyltransferase family protein [Microvirga alba]MBF9231754.1 lysophospholipid acyltransferase family protein [Microvirga alba]